MESHDEERYKAEQKAKMGEAKKEAERKRKLIEKQKMEKGHYEGMGSSSYTGTGGGGGSSYTGISSESRQSYIDRSDDRSSSYSRDRDREAAASNSGRGMVLGKSKKENTTAAQVLKEENVPDEDIRRSGTSSGPAVADVTAIRGPVHVSVEEKLVVKMDNDGGVEHMEIKGDLLVEVLDPSFSRIKLKVAQGENAGFQFKTHPLINKDAYTSNNLLFPKDVARGFQANSRLPILKWRLVSKDDSSVPLTISCWPSSSSDGLTYVTIEYELKAKLQLNDVSIAIPITTGTPIIGEVKDGNTEYNAKERVLYWKIPLLDQSNTSGSMEFNVPATSNSSFFPLNVTFTSSRTFCDIEITETLLEEGNKPVKFSKETQLGVEQYQITS